MDKGRELTPEPKPETGRKPLTTEAQELVDEIATKANLPPEEKTPEPTEETPKPPVTKEDVKKVITHLENIPTGDNASNQKTT